MEIHQQVHQQEHQHWVIMLQILRQVFSVEELHKVLLHKQVDYSETLLRMLLAHLVVAIIQVVEEVFSVIILLKVRVVASSATPALKQVILQVGLVYNHLKEVYSLYNNNNHLREN